MKPLFLDVGLLLTACGLTISDIVEADDLMLVNSGQVCEQFVGQHLLYRQESYIEPELFYWLREKAASNQYRILSLPFYLIERVPDFIATGF
jgi:hypothetical protein